MAGNPPYDGGCWSLPPMIAMGDGFDEKTRKYPYREAFLPTDVTHALRAYSHAGHLFECRGADL